MDNLFEILVPLIFFAVYFVSNILGKKSGDEDKESGEGGADDLRRIREELRRKIQERRKGSPEQSPQTPEKPARPEPASGGAVLRESQPHRGMTERRAQAPQPTPLAPAPDPFGQSKIERDLEIQMKQVELAREKADTARREAQKRVAAVKLAGSKRKAAQSSTNYRQFLKEALDDPENLQKSFILHEVFGTPVGMRRDGQMRSSFDL
tara:strand:+ start:11479 stop:12102 length:624 start_codon:yes stop_codon:yes gene_type:complete